MVIGTVKHRIQGNMECVNQLYRQVPGCGLKTINTFYEFKKVPVIKIKVFSELWVCCLR